MDFGMHQTYAQAIGALSERPNADSIRHREDLLLSWTGGMHFCCIPLNLRD